MAERPPLCPSGTCREGALLLGVVGPEAKVGYFGEPRRVDGSFVAAAREGRSPEARFRFATPCLEGGCRQWTGSRCGVIDSVLAEIGPETGASGLPACGIRPNCRWFRQSGETACMACPLVVTDTTGGAAEALRPPPREPATPPAT